MSLTIIDIIAVIIVALGGFIGFKRGLVKSVVSLVGLIIAFILAWILKGPISNFMYTNLPFIDFSGSLSLINILIFEFIAFNGVLGHYLSYKGSGIYVYLAICYFICFIIYFLHFWSFNWKI